MKRRIFIESDVLQEDELNSAKRDAVKFCEDNGESYCKEVFDEVLDYAWHDLEKTWKSVKRADEIHANTALMPLVGGSYMGAPVIFNEMCKKAIKEKVKGKLVIITRTLDSIYWGMIDFELMKKAFKNNKLFMYDDNYDMIEIDVSKLEED